MSPAVRSASMAICLPGMASRVKRAPTSATRPAPLVITTNWMTIRIRKTTRPTTTDWPMTKLPKVSITLPAWALTRIERVEDTLRARRVIVVNSSSDGKTENSRLSLSSTVASTTSTANVRLAASSTSSTIGDTGITIISTTPISEIGMSADERSDLMRTSVPGAGRPRPGRRQLPQTGRPGRTAPPWSCGTAPVPAACPR